MKREAIDRDVNMSDVTAKRQLLAQLAPLQGLYAVDVRPIRPTRSQQANRFYWRCVVESFRQFLAAQGQEFTKDEIHVLLGQKFRRVSVVNRETGGPIGATVRGSSGMGVEEFSDYIEKCVAWLADFGIVIPEPDHAITAAAGGAR